MILKLLKHLLGIQRKKYFLIIFIGDLGTNVLNSLYKEQHENIYYLAINTDLAHLSNNVMIDSEFKIFIGDKTDYS